MAESAKARQGRSGEPIQFYAPPGMRAALRGLAEEGRRPLTQEILLALEHWLARHGRPVPGREGKDRPKKIPKNPPIQP